MNQGKINDLSDSLLKKRYLTQVFIPETNLAVCMGRVSTKDQKDEGRSDEAQIERIEDYAEKERLRIVKSWDVAETASKHEKRKHFIALIDFVRKSHQSGIPIKHLLFSHQSRSNRNRQSARQLEDLIRDHEVTLHCVRDNLRLNCKSPQESWLMWDIFNNYNENFIKEHVKNVMDGTLKRVEMGLYPGRAPIGYKNVRKHNISFFEIDPVTGPYIKKMFELYAEGTYSVSMLVDELKKLKKLYPDDVREPSEKYVSKLLRNPFYIGEFFYAKSLFRGHPEYHPRLIEYDLWKKVQDVLTGKATFKKRWAYKQEFIFASLIKCGGHILDEDGNPTEKKCNGAVVSEVKRRLTKKHGYNYHYYYSCGNNRSVTGCSQRTKSYLVPRGLKRYLPQEKAVEFLGGLFTRFDYSAYEMKKIVGQYQKYEESLIGDAHKELARLKKEKVEVGRLIAQSYEDKISGVIPEHLWKEKYRKWMDEESRIKSEIKAFECTEPATTPRVKEWIEQAKALSSQYFSASHTSKRKFVELVGSNIILKDGKIDFSLRKPWNLLPPKGEIGIWWRIRESNSGLKHAMLLFYP